jgi:hypothetical protein
MTAQIIPFPADRRREQIKAEDGPIDPDAPVVPAECGYCQVIGWFWQQHKREAILKINDLCPSHAGPDYTGPRLTGNTGGGYG